MPGVKIEESITLPVSGTVVVSEAPTDTQTQLSFQNSEDVLIEILKELKIMNLHMSLITDTTINKMEVE